MSEFLIREAKAGLRTLLENSQNDQTLHMEKPLRYIPVETSLSSRAENLSITTSSSSLVNYEAGSTH